MSGSGRSDPMSGSKVSRIYVTSSTTPLHRPFAKSSGAYQRLRSDLQPSPSSTTRGWSHARSDVPAAVIPRQTSTSSSSLLPDEARAESARSFSDRSSQESLPTPPTPTEPSNASIALSKTPATCPDAKTEPLANSARQRSAKADSPAIKSPAKMISDDISPASSASRRSSQILGSHILGPDGTLHTQGEAARLGLIIRTACEACRNRKLKCSGTLPENGGCERCKSDNIECVYSARAPIGRPKKRKVEEGEDVEGIITSKGVKGQAANKGKAKSTGILSKVKTEENAVLGSPFSTPTSYGMYESPLQSSSGLASSTGHGSRLVTTPTVWSQNQPAFAMTPSDTLTPQHVISPAVVSHPVTNGQSSSSAAKLPSLDDLSVAAFLQSLDTLEISPAELLQQQLAQQQQYSSSSSSNPAAASYGLGTPFGSGAVPDPNQLAASSVEEWATSSAILQPGLSFAVPADFSWWDLGINGTDSAGSATASVAATPSTERASMSFTATQSALGQASPMLPPNFDGTPSPALSGPLGNGRSRRPTFSDQLWPRGADAGMGQGQIQHTVAATETGLGWSTLPGHSRVAESLSSPSDRQAAEGNKASCCSSKSNFEAAFEETAEEKPSCCAGKAVPKTEPKSCCSGHAPEPVPTELSSSDQIEMGPLSTSAAVLGSTKDNLDSDRKRHAATHSHHPSKVHCVPNPSGKGCTCLCDMSVALLSVKQVLRETDPHKQPSTTSSFATDTIQLTLTASQAITAQCACSADCPTCQSDPSTEISASLLVSTALQIYARAVRILREGFAASSLGKETGTGTAAATQSFFGGLDVTIGTYKPSLGNAKKIALYAIKLELKDLRRALGKISRMAQSFNSSTSRVVRDEADAVGEAGEQIKAGLGMNPIDQLVILKLYRQLTELLKTVEGLEDAA